MQLFYNPQIYQKNLFTEEAVKKLSKYRIIQKNLVHFQGFPDYLYNEAILRSPEYFGQYGIITKVTLSSKFDQKNQIKANSAYISFASNEQAAYAILAVDSIKINNQLVRAFFGTTKYCNHFLNNFNCFNQERCMFLHYLADDEDIIKDNSRFGYSEHIKLAKKIIEFGSLKSKLYVINNIYPINPILPTINTIYNKEKVIAKTKNHQKKLSNLSDDSYNVSASTESNGSNSFIKGEENEFLSIVDIKNENIEYKYDKLFSLYKSKNKSRFFPQNDNKETIVNKEISENLSFIIDYLSQKLSVPKEDIKLQNSNKKLLKENDLDFCRKIYMKTQDRKIKEIIEQIF